MITPIKPDSQQTHDQSTRKDGKIENQRIDSNSGGNPKASALFFLMEPQKVTQGGQEREGRSSFRMETKMNSVGVLD